MLMTVTYIADQNMFVTIMTVIYISLQTITHLDYYNPDFASNDYTHTHSNDCNVYFTSNKYVH